MNTLYISIHLYGHLATQLPEDYFWCNFFFDLSKESGGPYKKRERYLLQHKKFKRFSM